jgi:TonB family protein
VIVEAIIDEQGGVKVTRVLKGIPMGLDQSAVEAAKTWKFKPATLDGRPVPVYYVLTVNFQVSGGSGFYGPRFLRFLAQNPELAQQLQGQRFSEASALLDRLAAGHPGDPDIPLARTQLLVAQGHLDDAWQEAASYRGPEPFEILHCVGVAALNQTSGNKTPDADRRAAILEIGLEAETMAMAAVPDDPAPIYFKSRLLREKAALAADPEARQALIDEADRLQKRAVELQPKPAGDAPGNGGGKHPAAQGHSEAL